MISQELRFLKQELKELEGYTEKLHAMKKRMNDCVAKLDYKGAAVVQVDMEAMAEHLMALPPARLPSKVVAARAESPKPDGFLLQQSQLEEHWWPRTPGEASAQPQPQQTFEPMFVDTNVAVLQQTYEPAVEETNAAGQFFRV